MSAVTLSEFRAFQREMHDSILDPLLQEALDSAEEQVVQFIGFELVEFDGDVPATIRACIKALALIEVDELSPDKEQQTRGRVEYALRPYRREAGVRAA